MNAESVPAYGTSEAASAAGLQLRQLDSWLSRGAFQMGCHDIDAAGHGRPRKWSKRTIHKLGLMQALNSVGMTPSAAYTAAEAAMQGLDRKAFNGAALLSVAPGGCVKLIEVPHGKDFADTFDIIGDGAITTTVLVDINRLFASIDTTLNSLKD